jgi:hypothetical protein
MTDEGLLVRRRDTSTFPPKVFYSLTPEITEFIELVEPLVDWVTRNPKLVAQAQAYSRHHGEDDEDDETVIGIAGTDASALDHDDDTDDDAGEDESSGGRGLA